MTELATTGFRNRCVMEAMRLLAAGENPVLALEWNVQGSHDPKWYTAGTRVQNEFCETRPLCWKRLYRKCRAGFSMWQRPEARPGAGAWPGFGGPGYYGAASSGWHARSEGLVRLRMGGGGLVVPIDRRVKSFIYYVKVLVGRT